MKKTLHFNLRYFLLFLLLFFIEVLIALYSHHSVLRAYIGDVLVVILIYCFIKAFFKLPVLVTAISVLLFSYIIEMLQYFNIVEVLGLQHYPLARTVIGTSFSWLDILSYTAGIIIVLIVEKTLKKSTLDK